MIALLRRFLRLARAPLTSEVAQIGKGTTDAYRWSVGTWQICRVASTLG